MATDSWSPDQLLRRECSAVCGTVGQLAVLSLGWLEQVYISCQLCQGRTSLSARFPCQLKKCKDRSPQ